MAILKQNPDSKTSDMKKEEFYKVLDKCRNYEIGGTIEDRFLINFATSAGNFIEFLSSASSCRLLITGNPNTIAEFTQLNALVRLCVHRKRALTVYHNCQRVRSRGLAQLWKEFITQVESQTGTTVDSNVCDVEKSADLDELFKVFREILADLPSNTPIFLVLSDMYVFDKLNEQDTKTPKRSWTILSL